MHWLRDWSRSGGSYGNNTRVICCPAPGRPESAARGTSPPDNKSRGCCCRNSLPTVINPDYNMTKQRCMKRIYEKIHPKSPPNLATSPTCLHCDVTHLSLTTGVVALHIPSWRIEMREERRRARKIVWPVNAGRVICRYQNNLCGIINHHKHIRYCFFGCLSCGFKHNHNKPYRHWRQDGGWHALPIVTHATAWRRELLFYTSRRQGQPLQFRARNPRSHVIILEHWLGGVIYAPFSGQSPVPCIILGYLESQCYPGGLS